MKTDNNKQTSSVDASRIQRRHILVTGARAAAVVITLHAAPAYAGKKGARNASSYLSRYT